MQPFKITEKKDITIGRIFAVADSEVIVAAEYIRMKLLYIQAARIVKYIIAACIQLAGAHDDSVVEAFVEELEVGSGGIKLAVSPVSYIPPVIAGRAELVVMSGSAELAVMSVGAELAVGVVAGFGETGEFHA